MTAAKPISLAENDSATPVQPAPLAATAPQGAPAPAAPAAKPRGKGRRLVMFGVPVLLALGGGYAWLSGGRYEETENANLHHALMLIAADLAGRVDEVRAVDNGAVSKADLLFRIEDRPYRIALQQADATVAAARVQVAQLKSAYAAAQSAHDLTQSDLAYAKTDAKRQATPTCKGINSTASEEDAQHDLQQAQQAVAAAAVGIESAASALAGEPGASVDRHPLVLQALAAREKAAYTLSQTEVRAPEDGIVYQAASFRAGQFVTAGAPLFSLVYGDVGGGDHGRPDHRADAGRLADRKFRLALGVPDQPARRHRGLPRLRRHPARARNGASLFRPVRICLHRAGRGALQMILDRGGELDWFNSTETWSLHVMTGFSRDMGARLIVESGVVQGIVLGLVFVPLSTTAFATTEPRLRADARSASRSSVPC